MRNSSTYLLLFLALSLSFTFLLSGFSNENLEKDKIDQPFLEPFTLPLENKIAKRKKNYPTKRNKKVESIPKIQKEKNKEEPSKHLIDKEDPSKETKETTIKMEDQTGSENKNQEKEQKILNLKTDQEIKTTPSKQIKSESESEKEKTPEITKSVQKEEEEEEEEEKNPFPIPTRIICFTKTAVSSVIALDKSVSRIIAVTPESKQSAKNSFIESAHPDFFKISSSILSSNNYPHINAIKSFQPDFIIYDSFSHKNIKYNLKRHFKPDRLFELDIISEKSFNESMKKLASRLRKTKQWKKIYAYRKKLFNKIYERTQKIPSYKRPKVMFLKKIILEYKLIPWSKAIYYWINLSGGNAFGYTKELTKFFIEKSWIEKVNPDYIFIDSNPYSGYPDHIYQSQDLKSVTASKRTQVYKIPMNFNNFHQISIQSPMMWLFMSKLIQPELFQDIDFIAEIKYFFETFLNVKKLTMDAIKQVLLYEHNQLSRHFLTIF